MDKDKRYREALGWIHGLGRFGMKPGLGRITALLELLGNPHHKVRFVHLAGTNGKGSTAVMLASILREAGYRVGLYTSPYLLSFTNRMAINGEDIKKDDLIELVEQVRPLVERINKDPELGVMTEFEVVTTLALTYFSRTNLDLVVLETGLGGRLDATNVVDPLLSIITNVSLEHTDVLGDTVEKIAAEKAGIIKQNKPLLTAAEDPRVLKILEEKCFRHNSGFYRVYSPLDGEEAGLAHKPGAELQEISPEGQYFRYTGSIFSFERIFIPLRGTYQVTNAATALAALELLEKEGFKVSESELRSGLEKTEWPGRLELLSKNPYLIMDGAHNPAAIENLARSLPDYFKYRKLILVVGMMADKDIAAMLKRILPLADKVIFTRPVLPRAADPRELASVATEQLEFRKEHYVISEHGAALEKALELAGPEDAILVTGSLYTVSDVRAYWQDSRSNKVKLQ